MKIMKSKFKVILFDLGGVLVDFDGVTPLVNLTNGRLSREQARMFWFKSMWIKKFETGKCSPGEFASGVISELKLSISEDAFINEFKSWVHGMFPGALNLLNKLRRHYKIACLTNNNEILLNALIEKNDLTNTFHYCFISYQTGLMKPSREAFNLVLDKINVLPEYIIYFDDNIECIEMAREMGFNAYNVSGIKQVAEVLKKQNIMFCAKSA